MCRADSPTTFDSFLPSATNPRAGISQLSPLAIWDEEKRSLTTTVRAGRPYECGAGPHWNCGACMIPDSRGQQNCTDPTYPAAPVLNPTCMAQFNQTAADTAAALRGCRAERDAQAAEIARLRARVAQLEGAQ